jgi:hypothetical protein
MSGVFDICLFSQIQQKTLHIANKITQYIESKKNESVLNSESDNEKSCILDILDENDEEYHYMLADDALVLKDECVDFLQKVLVNNCNENFGIQIQDPTYDDMYNNKKCLEYFETTQYSEDMMTVIEYSKQIDSNDPNKMWKCTILIGGIVLRASLMFLICFVNYVDGKIQFDQLMAIYNKISKKPDNWTDQ